MPFWGAAMRHPTTIDLDNPIMSNVHIIIDLDNPIMLLVNFRRYCKCCLIKNKPKKKDTKRIHIKVNSFTLIKRVPQVLKINWYIIWCDKISNYWDKDALRILNNSRKKKTLWLTCIILVQYYYILIFFFSFPSFSICTKLWKKYVK